MALVKKLARQYGSARLTLYGHFCSFVLHHTWSFGTPALERGGGLLDEEGEAVARAGAPQVVGLVLARGQRRPRALEALGRVVVAVKHVALHV